MELIPPSNAMPKAIHSSQSEKFPDEVRSLIEEWKKKCYEIDNIICRNASNNEMKCAVLGCLYEKLEGDRLCQFHLAVGNYMLTLTYGLQCVTPDCKRKAERGSKDAICTCCRKGCPPPVRNESKKVRNEEEIREQARHDMQKVITCRNQIAKQNPGKVVTIYIGQTINGLVVRCYDHDCHPIKSGYVHREVIGKTADVKEGNIYEHESIYYLSEVLGPEYLINKQPGGGATYRNVQCEIYALYYTRHPLQYENQYIDFSMDVMEYNAIIYDTIHSHKYPPQPKLPPLPTFWNKVGVVQIMEMLGYTLREKCLKDYADENGLYKCKYEGCNKVFSTCRERNGHFRVHEVKCTYCPYVCKYREMGSHVKALHQDELAKLKPFACDERGCNTSCKTAKLLKVHKKNHHKK